VSFRAAAEASSLHRPCVARLSDQPTHPSLLEVPRRSTLVEGTRIPVVALVRAHQLGMDFDEILVQFPGLAPEGLHAALLYFLDHRAQIDALIARDLTPPSAALELEV
jgi:uncharacterized protein (DUF433 family)